MFELLLDSNNLPFTIAICIATAIGILELISLAIGGITDWVDFVIPESETGDLSGFSFTDFLCIGKIPFLMWLVVFLMSFGICGLLFQLMLEFNVFIASIIVLFISFIPTRIIANILHKVLPKDETTALYSDSFIGTEVEMILGKASFNYPAQAKFVDKHGQTHYLMVEPILEDETFNKGEIVILKEYVSGKFKAIKNS